MNAGSIAATIYAGQHLGSAGCYRCDLSRGGARVRGIALWRRYCVAGAPPHPQPAQSHRPVRHDPVAGVAVVGFGRALSVRLCQAGAGQFRPPSRSAARHGLGSAWPAREPTSFWRSPRRCCFTGSSFSRRARPTGSPQTSCIRCRSTRPCASLTCCRCRPWMAAGSRSACCRARWPIRWPGSNPTACRSCCCCCSSAVDRRPDRRQPQHPRLRDRRADGGIDRVRAQDHRAGRMSDGPVEQSPSATYKPAPMPSPAGAGAAWEKGEDRRPPRPEQLVLDLDGYEGPIDLLLSLGARAKSRSSENIDPGIGRSVSRLYCGAAAAQNRDRRRLFGHGGMARLFEVAPAAAAAAGGRRARGRGSRRRTRASAATPGSNADRRPHADGALAAWTGFLSARRSGGSGNGAGSGLAARALRTIARLWRQPPPNDECGVGGRALGLLFDGRRIAALRPLSRPSAGLARAGAFFAGGAFAAI